MNKSQNNSQPNNHSLVPVENHSRLSYIVCCRRGREGEGGREKKREVTFNGNGNALLSRPSRYPPNKITTNKYSLQEELVTCRISFLPVGTLVQFKRVSNFYFLMTAIICSIQSISPVPAYTAISPLVWVIVISLIREAYEDIKRRLNDREINRQECRILRQGKEPELALEELRSAFEQKSWAEVKVGDFLLIEEGDFVAADVIALLSSEENGEVFVSTSSLDGEKALKHKQCLNPIIAAIRSWGLSHFQFHLSSDPPQKDIFSFSGMVESEMLGEDGTMAMEGSQRSVGVDTRQLLLRGSKLEKTRWVVGAVAYTGRDTKIMRNFGKVAFKQSRIEKVINAICVYIIIVQTILILLLSILCGFFTRHHGNRENYYRAFYVFYSMDSDPREYSSITESMQVYAAYFILLNTVIPSSLIITLEVVKAFQAPFIQEDWQMCQTDVGKKAKCLNLSLHEELGAINYVFADKTGTLTANQMTFKGCSVASVCYDDQTKESDFPWGLDAADEPEEVTAMLSRHLSENRDFRTENVHLFDPHRDKGPSLQLKNHNDYLRLFWLGVGLCHEVSCYREKEQVHYQGTSPDEVTLLQAAASVGVSFTSRDSSSISLTVFGQEKTYQLLHKIEFSSERKRMSVIVREPEGRVLLFCKGSDCAVMSRLSEAIPQKFVEATHEDLNSFSMKGLRTLCFGVKVLEEEHIGEWLGEFDRAKIESLRKSFNQVDRQLDFLHEQIESDLFLLGATALEDKLQEGVPETIQDLREAGMKVWMLTGDKLETAENIAYSSKMFNEKMHIFNLNSASLKDTRARMDGIVRKMGEIDLRGKEKAKTQSQRPSAPASPNRRLDAEGQGSDNSREAKEVIHELEQFERDHLPSESSMNQSWSKRPVMGRRMREKLEEILPDKEQVIYRIINEHSYFHQSPTRTFSLFSAISISHCEGNVGILVEGRTLDVVLGDPELKGQFLRVLNKCQGVVICRATPSQKAAVVALIKHSLPEAVTLAIGDGANDVNMIKRAHIGVGIYGKEGYQAANSADYAFGQFRFLRRLLFVHGRWCNVRMTNFVLLFFHKNIIFTMQNFLFAFLSAYSGQTFWEPFYLSMFNAIATPFAIGAYAIWEQDLNVDDPGYSNLVDLFFPFLYKQSRDEENFTIFKFCYWTCFSLVQSTFLFLISILFYHNFSFHEGKEPDLWDLSFVAYMILVNFHYALLFFYNQNYTRAQVVFYLLSYSFYFPFFLFVSNEVQGPLQYRIYEQFFANGLFWQICLLSIVFLLAPMMAAMRLKALLCPHLKDLINQGLIEEKKVAAQLHPKKFQYAMDYIKQSHHKKVVQKQESMSPRKLRVHPGNDMEFENLDLQGNIESSLRYHSFQRREEEANESFQSLRDASQLRDQSIHAQKVMPFPIN